MLRWIRAWWVRRRERAIAARVRRPRRDYYDARMVDHVRRVEVEMDKRKELK